MLFANPEQPSSSPVDVPRGAALLVFSLSVIVGCGPAPEPEPFRLLARAEPLRSLLADCSLGESTGASRWCAELAQRIETCDAVEAICAAGDSACGLERSAVCLTEEEIAQLGLPAGTDFWLTGPASQTSEAGFDLRAVVQPERVRAALTFQSAEGEPWARWLPHGTLASPKLAAEGAFLLAQYRPEGGLVPPRTGEVSLAERLYGLRSELFSAAVLEGDLEIAVYPPNEGELFPRIAAFLGTKRRDLAVRGMESYIEELQGQWPIQRLDYEFDGREGACLDNLRVMPEFAPCYLATPDGLAIGWNRQSLEQALPPGASPVSGDFAAGPESARLVLDAQRLAVADEKLARARDRRPAYDYPVRALSLRAVPSPSGPRFEIELLRRAPR